MSSTAKPPPRPSPTPAPRPRPSNTSLGSITTRRSVVTSTVTATSARPSTTSISDRTLPTLQPQTPPSAPSSSLAYYKSPIPPNYSSFAAIYGLFIVLTTLIFYYRRNHHVIKRNGSAYLLILASAGILIASLSSVNSFYIAFAQDGQPIFVDNWVAIYVQIVGLSFWLCGFMIVRVGKTLWSIKNSKYVWVNNQGEVAPVVFERCSSAKDGTVHHPERSSSLGMGSKSMESNNLQQGIELKQFPSSSTLNNDDSALPKEISDQERESQTQTPDTFVDVPLESHTQNSSRIPIQPSNQIMDLPTHLPPDYLYHLQPSQPQSQTQWQGSDDIEEHEIDYDADLIIFDDPEDLIHLDLNDIATPIFSSENDVANDYASRLFRSRNIGTKSLDRRPSSWQATVNAPAYASNRLSHTLCRINEGDGRSGLGIGPREDYERDSEMKYYATLPVPSSFDSNSPTSVRLPPETKLQVPKSYKRLSSPPDFHSPGADSDDVEKTENYTRSDTVKETGLIDQSKKKATNHFKSLDRFSFVSPDDVWEGGLSRHNSVNYGASSSNRNHCQSESQFEATNGTERQLEERIYKKEISADTLIVPHPTSGMITQELLPPPSATYHSSVDLHHRKNGRHFGIDMLSEAFSSSLSQFDPQSAAGGESHIESRPQKVKFSDTVLVYDSLDVASHDPNVVIYQRSSQHPRMKEQNDAEYARLHSPLPSPYHTPIPSLDRFHPYLNSNSEPAPISNKRLILTYTPPFPSTRTIMIVLLVTLFNVFITALSQMTLANLTLFPVDVESLETLNIEVYGYSNSIAGFNYGAYKSNYHGVRFVLLYIIFILEILVIPVILIFYIKNLQEKMKSSSSMNSAPQIKSKPIPGLLDPDNTESPKIPYTTRNANLLSTLLTDVMFFSILVWVECIIGWAYYDITRGPVQTAVDSRYGVATWLGFLVLTISHVWFVSGRVLRSWVNVKFGKFNVAKPHTSRVTNGYIQ